MGSKGSNIYYKVWNDHYPEDKKIIGDGYDIHHKDGNHENNDIENLEKIKHSDHLRGDLNPMKKKEARDKMSALLKNRVFSNETKKKMRKAKLGRKLSEETKRKMGEARKGEKNGMFGKKHSEESKMKMSLHRIGKKHTEEAKKRMSDAQKRIQERIRMTGEKIEISDKTRKKKSESAKRAWKRKKEKKVDELYK